MRRAAFGSLLLLSRLAAAQEPASPADFEPPEVLERAEVVYPPEALAGRIEGTVGLKILIDPEGNTAEVEVVVPAGHGFDEAAVDAVRKFKWRPARSQGKAVPVRVRYDLPFVLPPLPEPEPATIRGTVLERGTRRPLPYAEVAVTAGGRVVAETQTDDKGGFAVEGLEAGSYEVVVAALLHKRRVFPETVAAGETLTVRYLVELVDQDPYTTTVEGERPREELERRSATRDEATRVAGTRGDALRVVENFPGVARPPLGVGALIVRGSNPEDTSPYVAGHWNPLIYHFGGITSIINTDLLERIDFLPGNFSARYGRAIGGIVDVELRAPRRDRFHGYIDVSLLDAGFLFEGPIGKGSWALAARRSYVDLVLDAVIPDDAGFAFFSAPRYWDYQALLDYPLWGGRLSLQAFGSSDEFGLVLSDPADFDPGLRGSLDSTTYIQRIHATWRKTLSERTRLYASIAQGYTHFGLGFGQFLDVDLKVWFGSWRVELTHRPFRRVKVTAGTEGQLYPAHVLVRGPRPPEEGEIPTPASAQETLSQDRTVFEVRAGAFLEAELDLGRGFTVTPGTRIDYYRLNQAFAADPRISARWSDGANTVRAGVGQFSQPPLEFESDPVYGNPNIRPLHALHFSLGYDRQLAAPLRIESTLFYKWLWDLTVKDLTLIRRGDGTVAPIGYSNVGEGQVYGAELLVRWNQARDLFGWVSYTLSRSERKNATDDEMRLFMFDQTHILTLVANLRLPWKLVFGFRFRYVSGNPTTPIVGSLYDADSDVYTPIPGDVNSERLDPYHQLDLRLERTFTFDSWRMTAYIDVQNAYNRANPEAYAFSYDYREREVIPSLPIFPSFGVKGEF